MTIKITWYEINDDNQVLWQVNRGLYAYLGPNNEVLYIGKVNGTTIRTRFQASAKPALWNFIVNDLGIDEVTILAGLVELPEGSKHSRQRLSDIESLLIYEIKPAGNIACRDSRICRPGLNILCRGDWRYHRRKFLDI